MSIAITVANIATLPLDAIVNAANPALLGGGGVDGAIHRAAGPALLEACRALAQVRPNVRCPPGEARMTPGFALPARFVIHTVGPIWQDGRHGEADLLASCHRQSMALAAREGLRTIAFPAISCGVYGYPPDLAAEVAVSTLRETLQRWPDIAVTLCAYSDAMVEHWQRALDH